MKQILKAPLARFATGRSSPYRITALLFAGTVIGVVAGASRVSADDQLKNKDVTIEYIEPRYEKIYQYIKVRQVLEEFNAVLSPLKLDHPLKIQVEDTTADCRDDSPNSFYDMEYTVHVCYNWLDMLINDASQKQYDDPKEFNLKTQGLMPGVTPAEVILGGTVSTILHELGHAIFHNLDVPRLGREEDAADQIAGLMTLQFGPGVAVPVIKGTLSIWHHLQATDLAYTGGISATAQSDVHSLSLQRGLNFLCLAYGGPNSAAFKELADTWLTDDRKANCASEYKTALNAFNKSILPRVDQDAMKKVLAMPIFHLSDFQ